jgi:hypothetical protein
MRGASARGWNLLISTGEFAGIPPPGCFAKRGCKPLKTKGEGSQKMVKRRQVLVNKSVGTFAGPNV